MSFLNVKGYFTGRRNTAASNTMPLLAAGALGIWLGVHAFRSLVSMVVWNVAEDLPSSQMALIALSVYSLGLAAWIPARLFGGPRPVWRFGILLAVLTIARQALPGEILSPVLSFATGVVWLWWLPAFIKELANRDALGLAVPAVLIGLAWQAAGQAALHGLDLHMISGTWSVLGAVALAGAFVGASWLASMSQALSPPAEGLEAGASWGALALGPFLFLQLTLLTNLGRVETISGRGATGAVAIILLSLLAALSLLGFRPSRRIRIGLGALALILTIPGLWPHQVNFWALVPLQAILALELAAAFAPAKPPARGHTYGAVAVGALLLFMLMFAYYSRYGWPLLWFVTTAMVVLAGLRPEESVSFKNRTGLALITLSVIGLGLGLAPYSRAVPINIPAPAELKIYNYNIHNGFDTWSVPSIQGIVGDIEASGADIVSLQEVNRGWNLSGGVDIVSYLRWRFPEYFIIYGPMNGDLWGNIIMSRYPVAEWGTEHFTPGRSDFPRGFVWAKISTRAGEMFFMTTHFSAYEGYDEDRISQSAELLDFWKKRPRTVIAGDFNARPDDEAIKKLVAGGLKDVPAGHGLREAFTYSAAEPDQRIDYIFSSPDVTSISAQIPRTVNSDHLPVAATVSLR
ncbi:MAG: endonuclease/exonuclease/phosphatase family protein [Bacillota bacterium]